MAPHLPDWHNTHWRTREILMTPQVTTPPPDRTSQGTWPNGEPQSVRDAADIKCGTK
jgi:hypothetical protein